MHPDLVQLLELQSKDLTLLEADKALDGILAELEGLEFQIGDAVQAADKADRALTDAKRRRAESESKVENYRKSIGLKKLQLESLQASVEAATQLFQAGRGLGEVVQR